jgi:hypothetical protein
MEDPLPRQSETRAQPLRASNVMDGLDAEGCFGKVDWEGFLGVGVGGVLRVAFGVWMSEVWELRCWRAWGDGVKWVCWKRGRGEDDAAARRGRQAREAPTTIDESRRNKHSTRGKRVSRLSCCRKRRLGDCDSSRFNLSF